MTDVIRNFRIVLNLPPLECAQICSIPNLPGTLPPPPLIAAPRQPSVLHSDSRYRPCLVYPQTRHSLLAVLQFCPCRPSLLQRSRSGSAGRRSTDDSLSYPPSSPASRSSRKISRHSRTQPLEHPVHGAHQEIVHSRAGRRRRLLPVIVCSGRSWKHDANDRESAAGGRAPLLLFPTSPFFQNSEPKDTHPPTLRSVMNITSLHTCINKMSIISTCMLRLALVYAHVAICFQSVQKKSILYVHTCQKA
ncbi:uncharacterized protein LOC125525147 isoform X2 [Triticum urartu]|uniref:uncharacterized protein LOC125525147 isoform X2 n=1 Tax=Triticum urartu TaxID=4572 RepID=UPI0020437415|nr:uncharacterized protein LOC125525147 isoform X2 [Triticum urartu]